jgi:hypothetical protein
MQYYADDLKPMFREWWIKLIGTVHFYVTV